MAERRYYVEGNTARKLNYDRGTAAPARVPQPERRPKKATTQVPARKNKRATHITDEDRRALAARKARERAIANAQIRYTAGIVVAVVIAVALCCYLLELTSEVKTQKDAVASLKSQVAAQLDENSGYSAGLDSMTDLNEIYNIATTKLGMVYSQPGQTIYYSQNSDDYVVQYKDVPEAK